MRLAPADAVRATIAAHLGVAADEPMALGEILLHAHQRVAVDRLVALLGRHRGALLADDVGLGKTFVALAVARRARDPLVIAPAALRDGWTRAADRAGVGIRFASTESLSRRDVAPPPGDMVVVDEAHHFRTTRTRRFAAARSLCERAQVLLLSATPVQNSLDDLRSVLGLFLGERGRAMTAEELGRYVVRRTVADVRDARVLRLPDVAGPEWVHGISDVDCLERLLALPPPVAPSDGGDGGALVTYSLVRQWASSRSALRGALRRRLARARALDDSLAAGRWPTREELSAWCFADGAQQLTFPELVVSSGSRDCDALRDQVLLHADSVRDLIAWLDGTPDPDMYRVDRLLDLHARHAGERMVVFSEYAETVETMYRALAPLARVAMIARDRGRVAGGPLPRADLLTQFRPQSTRCPDHERVDLLLTTDVLSEGVDLQRASVAVHLDLSWNPARLEQRVGRLRRIGAARDRVTVYAFAPPAPAERLIGLERRLRVKLGEAASSVGLAGAILPGLSVESESPVARSERIRGVVASWADPARVTRESIGCAVRSPVAGALACVRRKGDVRLVAMIDDRIGDAPEMIESLVAVANGEGVDIEIEELERELARFRAWLARRGTSDVLEIGIGHVARSRQHLLRRVNAIAHRSRRHERGRFGDMLSAARLVATATLSAGAERVLDQLAHAEMSDVAWLTSVGEFASLHSLPNGEADAVLAVVLLRHL